MYRFFFLSILVSFISSCGGAKVAEDSEPEVQIQEEQNSIMMSRGGGFTGKYAAYRIKQNGEIEKWDELTNTSTPLGVLDEANTEALFAAWAKVSMPEAFQAKPGNMNYSISFVSSGAALNIKWSDSQVPSKDVLEFFNQYYYVLSGFE